MNIEKLDRLLHAACRYVVTMRKSPAVAQANQVIAFEDLTKAADAFLAELTPEERHRLTGPVENEAVKSYLEKLE